MAVDYICLRSGSYMHTTAITSIDLESTALCLNNTHIRPIRN
jgi:hypothetical protein